MIARLQAKAELHVRQATAQGANIILLQELFGGLLKIDDFIGSTWQCSFCAIWNSVLQIAHRTWG